MIARAENTAGKARSQLGLTASDLGGIQPMDIETLAFLILVCEAELFRVVTGRCDNQGAFITIADGPTGGGFQFLCKYGPNLLGLEVER